MNPALAVTVVTGAALSFGLNSWLGSLGIKLGWLDRADGELKVHRRPLPWTGGIGLWVVLCLVCLVRISKNEIVPGLADRKVLAVVAAAGLGLAAGLLDDLLWKSTSRPLLKLGGQGISAGAGAALMLSLNRAPISAYGPFAWLLASLVLLIGMNALNLEDGLDGLASAETLVSALGFGMVLLKSGERSLAGLSFVLAGVLAGFLLLNWHPARLFLGDNGSHMLGSLLAGLALSPRVSAFSDWRSVLGVLLIGIPLLDMAWVIINRLVQSRSIFAGDREHLYDLLRRKGLSVPITVAVMVSAQLIIVAVAVWSLTSGS